MVDVENRRFVTEISTRRLARPPCPAGERGFLMLCGDGTLQWIGLDENGAEAVRVRTEPFFSVEEDPVFDHPVQTAEGWQLMSFEGTTREVVVRDGEIVLRGVLAAARGKTTRPSGQAATSPRRSMPGSTCS